MKNYAGKIIAQIEKNKLHDKKLMLITSDTNIEFYPLAIIGRYIFGILKDPKIKDVPKIMNQLTCNDILLHLEKHFVTPFISVADGINYQITGISENIEGYYFNLTLIK